MSRSRTSTRKLFSLQTVLSSFAGMIMAVPFAFALSSPSSNAQALQGQASTQASQASMAQFAYAYNQGYEAHTASVDKAVAGVCTDPSASMASASAGTTSAVAASAPMMNSGGGGSGSGGGGSTPKVHTDKVASMVNSYNTYMSTIYNSVSNTNSGNVVGSNNTTTTSVDVSHSKGVMVGVSNDPYASQTNVNDSFNKDSYNTKNESTAINDSYNQVSTVDVTKTENSNNTTSNQTTSNTNTTTTQDSNNTSSNTTNTTNTENKVIDSYNETTITAPEHGMPHES